MMATEVASWFTGSRSLGKQLGEGGPLLRLTRVKARSRLAESETCVDKDHSPIGGSSVSCQFHLKELRARQYSVELTETERRFSSSSGS
jgi:hypothetical protein